MKSILEKLKVNVWRLLTVAITLYALIIIGKTGVSIVRILVENSRLKAERDLYLESYKRDSLLLESLNNDAELERYAREHFYMQRKNEQVYIVE